jgi:hypothetical protein
LFWFKKLLWSQGSISQFFFISELFLWGFYEKTDTEQSSLCEPDFFTEDHRNRAERSVRLSRASTRAKIPILNSSSENSMKKRIPSRARYANQLFSLKIIEIVQKGMWVYLVQALVTGFFFTQRFQWRVFELFLTIAFFVKESNFQQNKNEVTKKNDSFFCFKNILD